MILFFFLITTKLEHQDECHVGAMIPTSNFFSSSFLTIGVSLGLTCLNFCLNGFVEEFKGILCWTLFVSKVFKSS